MAPTIICPPFTEETAIRKVRMAEDAWNTRDPARVALAYTEDSKWRNRSEFFQGRPAIIAFLERKWKRELEYRLIKELWAHGSNRIAVRFQYEWHDDDNNWFRPWQRAVGVRRQRPDAPPRGQHQRRADPGRRPQVPVATGPSAGRPPRADRARAVRPAAQVFRG
jgi:nuclear transport factor 2 (NTF2) superfamily protein